MHTYRENGEHIKIGSTCMKPWIVVHKYANMSPKVEQGSEQPLDAQALRLEIITIGSYNQPWVHTYVHKYSHMQNTLERN